MAEQPINDDLLQCVMDARDPAYGKAVPPPTLTLAQMRAQAGKRGRLPWWRWQLHWLRRRLWI